MPPLRAASPRIRPPPARICVTAGAPTVTVPVLSRINVSTSEARSRKSALLMRMRRRVATVIAATTAAGPATTRAVGVATTSTAMARERSSVKNSVVAARVSTSGSQTPARRSKSRSTGTEVRSTSARSCDHPPENGIGARPAHLNFEQSVQRHRPGEDRAAGPNVLVERLAGDGGLIHRGAAFEHGAVDRDPLSGPHQDLISRARGCSDRRAPRRRCATSPPAAPPSARIPSMAARAPRELRSSKRRPSSRKSGISVAVTKSPVAAAASTAIATNWSVARRVSPVTIPRRPEMSVGIPTTAAAKPRQSSPICHWSGSRRTSSVPRPSSPIPTSPRRAAR